MRRYEIRKEVLINIHKDHTPLYDMWRRFEDRILSQDIMYVYQELIEDAYIVEDDEDLNRSHLTVKGMHLMHSIDERHWQNIAGHNAYDIGHEETEIETIQESELPGGSIYELLAQRKRLGQDKD